MQAAARTPLHKFSHDIFNIAWPMLLLIAVGGPLYYAASHWLNADHMATVDEGVRLTARGMSIIGGVFCGTLSLFTLGTIGMALYTRIRTVKQCVGPFLGSIFFAALYFMLMSA